LLDLPQMTETEKGTIKEVLVLQTPPNSELMEMSENINQIHLSAPPGLLSYPVRIYLGAKSNLFTNIFNYAGGFKKRHLEFI